MLAILPASVIAAAASSGCPEDDESKAGADGGTTASGSSGTGTTSSGAAGGSSGSAGSTSGTAGSTTSSGTTSGDPGGSSSGTMTSTSSGTMITDSGMDADAQYDGSDGYVPPTTGLDPAYQHFDVNHILETGQSNSVANSSLPVLDTAQPSTFNNLMFNVGVMTGYNCDGNGCQQTATPTSLVPLVEGDTFFANSPVETMSSSLANSITKTSREVYLAGNAHPSHDLLVSLHGRSGRTYWCLSKRSCSWLPAYQNPRPFQDGMNQVTAGKALTQALGKTYVVRAVTAIHGESDHNGYVRGTPEFPLDGTDGTPNKITDYTDGLIEWQQDYESGVKAITGQTLGVPLLISGISGWNEISPMSVIANMQLAAHVRAPRKVVLVAPGYPFQFQNDCLHYTSASQRRLGEYFAKAYKKIVLEGGTYEPLRPLQVTRNANVITIKYVVPKPPMVIDTTLVANVANYGFTYLDASGNAAPAITGVALAGPDTVTVTLASAPTGGTRKIRYAQNQIAQSCVGPALGARGNLRDSDNTPTNYINDPVFTAPNGAFSSTNEALRYKAPLYNWGVMYEMDVP